MVTCLFVVTPVSVEVKKLSGAAITVFKSLSWRMEEDLGTTVMTRTQALPINPMDPRPARRLYIPR